MASFSCSRVTRVCLRPRLQSMALFAEISGAESLGEIGAGA